MSSRTAIRTARAVKFQKTISPVVAENPRFRAATLACSIAEIIVTAVAAR
jgi:hypothetical protein